jgi:hypothetical protein
MEQRIAEMNAERNRRYAELREHAAEVGIELPETPPWNEVEAPGSGMPSMPSDMGMPAMPAMPAMPGMPADRDAARDARYQAMRERAKARGMELPETPPYKLMTADEHRAQMERMRNMTPEERMAARAETYKQLRERAAAKGIDLPETPPWEQAAQRRKAMQEKWDAYRKEVDAMTDAQREAAQAMFGARPGPEAPQMPMQPPMQRPMPMDMPGEMPMDMPMPGQGPRGFGPGPCPQGDCGGMMPPRGIMPGWGGGQGSDQAPPPPQGGYGAPWGRGY